MAMLIASTEKNCMLRSRVVAPKVRSWVVAPKVRIQVKARLWRDPALDDQYCAFDFALISWLARPRGQLGRVVMRGHIGEGLGNRGLKPERLDHCRFQIVADDRLWHTTEKLQRADLRLDPVGQRLGQACPGKDVAGCAQHSDEDLRLMHSACGRIGDRDRVVGIVWPGSCGRDRVAGIVWPA